MKFSCALVIGSFGFGILLVGIRGAIEVHTYTQTSCFVKNSSLWICGQQTSINSLTKKCIQPKWLIKFIYYKKKEETTILGEKHYVSDVDDSSQTYELDKYRVGEIYPCYHPRSQYSTGITWQKPSFTKYIVFFIVGFILFPFYIYHLIKTDRSDDNCRNHENNQPTVTRVPIATNEENVPLSPPPAYTPSISDSIEGNIVSTPPPPSYETQIRQIDEQEHIPISPPPPYPLTPT